MHVGSTSISGIILTACPSMTLTVEGVINSDFALDFAF